MESRKIRNREIEKAKRNRKRVGTTIFTLVIIAAACFLVYMIWDNINRRTIMTIEWAEIGLGQTSVATSDFRFFYMSQEAGDEAADNAMDELLARLTLLERANYHNLSLTSEERTMLLEEAATVREMHPPGTLGFISNGRIADLWSADFLIPQLMEIYSQDIELDEEDFAERLAEHMEIQLPWVADMYIKYVASVDPAELENAFTEYAYEADELEPIEFWEFVQSLEMTWEQADLIIELEVGEVAELIEIHGVFYSVLMYSRTFDPEIIEEMENDFRTDFENSARSMNFFEEHFSAWRESFSHTVNNRAFNRF
jgi:hypothetical protein